MNCTACRAETTEGFHLCGRHTGELVTHLANVPDVWTNLQDTISLQASTPGGPGGAAGTKPPINLHALDVAEKLTAVLKGWGEQFTDVTGLTTPHIAARLHQYRRALPRWELAGELLLELRDSMQEAAHTTDRALEYAHYGPCPCGGTIRGTVGANTARCRVCGDRYDAAELQAWRVSQAWGVAAPLPDVLRALGQAGYGAINPEKAKKWVQRGKLHPAACDVGTRRQLFTPAAVIAAYRETPMGRKSTVGQIEAA